LYGIRHAHIYVLVLYITIIFASTITFWSTDVVSSLNLGTQRTKATMISVCYFADCTTLSCGYIEGHKQLISVNGLKPNCCIAWPRKTGRVCRDVVLQLLRCLHNMDDIGRRRNGATKFAPRITVYKGQFARSMGCATRRRRSAI